MSEQRPAEQINMPCPNCSGRVIAVVRDEQAHPAMRRWYGQCSLCKSSVTLSASNEAARVGRDAAGEAA